MEPLQAYTRWIADIALPTWSTLGFDATAARFCERLDSTGRTIDVPHRSMVQARQIYVFSHACQLGWCASGGELAEVAMRSLLRDFCTETSTEANFAFSIDRHGQVLSSVRDAYGHAFVLFALSWLYRLNGDAHLLAIARKTNTFIKARLFDEVHGGLFDAYPATDRSKRQNPIMHLLEAYLSLERAAPGQGYLEEAAGLVALFKAHLFSADHRVVLEYFGEDWSPHPDRARAQLFEPGHHFEWVWLLQDYQALAGDDLGQWSRPLYNMARDHGVHPGGLLYDEVATDLRVLKTSHRIWPHTEGIKAAKARFADGDAEALPFAESMARGMLEHFLDKPFAGGWTDHIDATGRPLTDYAPASTLYHLFFAAAEASQGFAGTPGTTG